MHRGLSTIDIEVDKALNKKGYTPARFKENLKKAKKAAPDAPSAPRSALKWPSRCIVPSEKMLMRGSHVVGEAAVRAGCRFYAGYPITPQNELPEYLSARMLERGRHVYSRGKRDCLHQHGAGCCGRWSPGHDLLFVTGHCPEAGRDLLSLRHGTAGGSRQHDARGTGPGEYCALGCRLLPGHERRRQRRLPYPGAGAGRMPGIVRPDLCRL